MNTSDYNTTILVNQSPKEVLEAINNVRGWWSRAIEGDTSQSGSVFYYHYKDIHRCTFKITEIIPGKKVSWHVLHNYFSFVQDQSEWNGTDIVFEIERKGDQTEVRFTHVGLAPEHECYGVCSDSWSTYINKSLGDLIAKGEGNPNPIEEVVRQVS